MCFSHIDADGNAVMVDVTEKADTHRRAVAAGSIRMNEEAFAAVRDKTARKGDVLGVAQVAGISIDAETNHPTEADLITGCTMNVNSFIAVLEKSAA